MSEVGPDIERRILDDLMVEWGFDPADEEARAEVAKTLRYRTRLLNHYGRDFRSAVVDEFKRVFGR